MIIAEFKNGKLRYREATKKEEDYYNSLNDNTDDEEKEIEQ